MNKKCVVCGKEFESKTIRAKYCCKVCSNHSRFNRTRSEWLQENNDLRNRVFALYQEGKNDIQIADELEKSISWVHNIRSELGLKKQLTILQRKVLECRQQGMCCTEIADNLNIDSGQIQNIVKAIEMPFTEEEKKRSVELGKRKATIIQYGTEDERISRCKDFINQYHPDWEYVSGFINSDGFMKIKCLKCNSVVNKSAVSIRKKRMLKCSVCDEQNKKQKIADRQKRQEQDKYNKFWNQTFEQFSFTWKECPECGIFFSGKYKYCSDECKRKSTNRKMDHRIRKQYQRSSDITLKKLYNRDKGVCWLCGRECDYTDYLKDEKGSFIAGKNYPSIDHVYPLSLGGKHSWENVKLAHFYCNTVKSNKVVCL